jgi:hypothetical protein
MLFSQGFVERDKTAGRCALLLLRKPHKNAGWSARYYRISGTNCFKFITVIPFYHPVAGCVSYASLGENARRISQTAN